MLSKLKQATAAAVSLGNNSAGEAHASGDAGQTSSPNQTSAAGQTSAPGQTSAAGQLSVSNQTLSLSEMSAPNQSEDRVVNDDARDLAVAAVADAGADATDAGIDGDGFARRPVALPPGGVSGCRF